MKRTFLVNADFIGRKIQADGRKISRIIEDSGETLSQQTLKSMVFETDGRFTFTTICKVSKILKTSVANLIRADEHDRNKELDAVKLQSILDARRIKNKELAKMSHTDASSVSAYLLGKKTPSVELVYCLASGLDIEPGQLLKKKSTQELQATLFEDETTTNTEITKKALRIVDTLIEMLSDLREDLQK